MLMLLLQTNPIEPISKYGPYLGTSILCTGLFIWSQIQQYQIRKTLESHTEIQRQANAELKSIVEQLATAQAKQAESIHQLAEAIHHQTERQGEMHSEQLNLIREMVLEQKLMAQSQTTIINGFQRVVENLIDAVKD